jgi:radical SAM protein with 4Fe4S-binding SPASM domain
VHCYLAGEREREELSTNGWIEVLNQAADLGCLFVALTGGEPLMRRDFARIYLHAKSLGMLVTVMTNGALINQSILDLFEEWPPHRVDVSLYGWDPATYNSITGRDVGPEVYRAVDAMLARNVRVTTKTFAICENLDELERIREWATERGVPFRADGDVIPTLSGGQAPKEHQISIGAVLGLEKARRGKLIKPQVGTQKEVTNHRFQCSAGKTSFHVSPDGRVSLCILDRTLTEPGRSLSEVWRGEVRERRMVCLPAGHPCIDCEVRPYCDACPPILRMEARSEECVSSVRCTMARMRALAIAEQAD